VIEEAFVLQPLGGIPYAVTKGELVVHGELRSTSEDAAFAIACSTMVLTLLLKEPAQTAQLFLISSL
jgi:hypothetical protein